MIRQPNGWTIQNETIEGIYPRIFVFESTESLQRQLVRLLGKSGWKVEMPERDEKGHFKPKETIKP